MDKRKNNLCYWDLMCVKSILKMTMCIACHTCTCHHRDAQTVDIIDKNQLYSSGHFDKCLCVRQTNAAKVDEDGLATDTCSDIGDINLTYSDIADSNLFCINPVSHFYHVKLSLCHKLTYPVLTCC